MPLAVVQQQKTTELVSAEDTEVLKHLQGGSALDVARSLKPRFTPEETMKALRRLERLGLARCEYGSFRNEWWPSDAGCIMLTELPDQREAVGRMKTNHEGVNQARDGQDQDSDS